MISRDGPVWLQPVLLRVPPLDQGLRAKVATPEEWDLAAGEPQAFFRGWTAKEATLKLTGRGLGGLRGCRVVRVVDREFLETGCEGRIYRVRQLHLQNHWAAVAGEAAAVQWHVLDSADLRPEDGGGGLRSAGLGPDGRRPLNCFRRSPRW